VHGQEQTLSYMHGARFDRRHRGSLRHLSIISAFVRQFIYPQTQHCLYTVADGNDSAGHLFRSGRFGMGQGLCYGSYKLALIRPRHCRGVPRTQLVIAEGQTTRLAEIVAFLNRHGREKLFFPVCQTQDFSGPNALPAIGPQDFLLATCNGEIVGAMALWDQTSFKRLAIHNHGSLASGKSSGGLLGKAIAKLLVAGQSANNAEMALLLLSFIAIKDDDAAIFQALLSAAVRQAAKRGCNIVACGLHERDPLLAAVQRLDPLYLGSQIYCTSLHDSIANIVASPQVIPYLELGTL